jgi:protease-4
MFLEKKPGFLESLLTSAAGGNGEAEPDAFTRVAAQPRVMIARAFDGAERLLSGPALQARCLECGPADLRPEPRSSSHSTLADLIGVLTR